MWLADIVWEGLGYYSRARNLKKAAIKIMEAYQGVFPDTYEEILKLPEAKLIFIFLYALKFKKYDLY